MQALSQLSYSPKKGRSLNCGKTIIPASAGFAKLVDGDKLQRLRRERRPAPQPAAKNRKRPAGPGTVL